MKILLIANQCITDSTAGVAHSLRQMMCWLADAGHDCRCLCTSRFETPVSLNVQEHIADWDEHYQTRHIDQRLAYHFDMQGTRTVLLHTTHHDETKPDQQETIWFLHTLSQLVEQQKPDLIIALNGHPMIFQSLAWAKSQHITTAYALRGYGYESTRYFEHVDHAFTCSEYLTEHYQKAIGLFSTPLAPPIDWSTVEAPLEQRQFVTFINPMATKGLVLFARLADMLGKNRPDIPILIIQSGATAGHLNAIEGLNLSQYPQILVGPATQSPWEIYALTKMLLVPSIWPEPFGRVAAEALINGIPPLVSERGGLPDVVGGDFSQGGAGRVLPIPAWLNSKERRIPQEDEVRPWFDAICELWDRPSLYESMAKRGRVFAKKHYSESVSRKNHVHYVQDIVRSKKRSVF